MMLMQSLLLGWVVNSRWCGNVG